MCGIAGIFFKHPDAGATLGRSLVNMLDGCALSLPCHAEGELPASLMLWHAALHDDAVLAVALQVERELQATRD